MSSPGGLASIILAAFGFATCAAAMFWMDSSHSTGDGFGYILPGFAMGAALLFFYGLGALAGIVGIVTDEKQQLGILGLAANAALFWFGPNLIGYLR